MVLTGRLVNRKIITYFLAKIRWPRPACSKMFLGPVNAVKQTVGPDQNKGMRQPAALLYFLATFL